MKLPWISREHHQEVKSLLESQVERLESERKQLLDHIQTISIGRTIFEKPAPKPKPVEATPDIEMDPSLKLIKDAQKAGYTTPRGIAEYITKENEKHHAEQARKAAESMKQSFVQETKA